MWGIKREKAIVDTHSLLQIKAAFPGINGLQKTTHVENFSVKFFLSWAEIPSGTWTTLVGKVIENSRLSNKI